MSQSQFVVYHNVHRSGARAPYVVNAQAGVFDFASCIVVPLVKPDYFGSPIQRLNPTLTVRDESFILSPQEMTAALLRDLGSVAGDLSPHRDDIIAALDTLFTGI